eukprot:1458560-Karenia_brevis.AAC.1
MGIGLYSLHCTVQQCRHRQHADTWDKLRLSGIWVKRGADNSGVASLWRLEKALNCLLYTSDAADDM